MQNSFSEGLMPLFSKIKKKYGGLNIFVPKLRGEQIFF